jgi:hypothetical protein
VSIVIQSFKDLLADWGATRPERLKLQHTYLAVSLFGFVLAGLVGLLNYDASRLILKISFAGLAIFVINAIVWALLYSLVIVRFPGKEAPAIPRKKA